MIIKLKGTLGIMIRSQKEALYFFVNIYCKKILHHSSENIKRILAIIVNCEMCIVNYELQYIYDV
ncbi:protein of unknown function [Clostridium beijerinckii]|nr:protein of unknown function [Clostridium beijerinckii]